MPWDAAGTRGDRALGAQGSHPAFASTGGERPSRATSSTDSGRAVALVFAVVLAAPTAGQDLDPLRDELSRRLHDVQFAGGFSGLVLVTDEIELSSTRFSVDDDVGTKVSTLVLPFHTTLRLPGESPARLYVEGVVGYGSARQSVDDLYRGALPGAETAVKANWKTYGALLGAGPAFEIAEGFVLAVMADLGISRIESDADYTGPGAELSAALFDGIGLNWDAWVVTVGGASRLDASRPLGERFGLEAMVRYDLRWSRSFAATDEAQEFTNRLQAVTFRTDLTGPTGLKPFSLPLSWRALAGVRHLVEGEVFGVEDIVQFGGAVELSVAGRVPRLRTLRLGATVVRGPEVSGWSVGGGGSF